MGLLLEMWGLLLEIRGLAYNEKIQIVQYNKDNDKIITINQ